jgi:hypothetical protein
VIGASALFILVSVHALAATDAADAPPTFELGGARLSPIAQLRVRGEAVPDRSLLGEPARLLLTHRARIGGAASLDLFDFVISVQDVQAWGEARPDNGLPERSLHVYETYVGFHLGDALEARVGRQGVSMANERLIGKAEFAMQARAYDAVRVILTTPELVWSTFGGFVVHDLAPPFVGDTLIGATALEWRPTDWVRVAPAFIYDGHVGDPANDRQRGTFGARIDGGAAGFGYEVEGFGQVTRLEDASMSFGMMSAARLTYSMKAPLNPKLGVLTDVISGRAPGAPRGDLAPFDTINGTNHAFYGHADLFTALPAHTKGRGLVDSAATLWIHEGPWSGLLALHAFAPFSFNGPGLPFYGIEPNVFGSYKPMRSLAFEGGCALFIPVGSALDRGPSPAAWAYLQVQVQL